MKEIDILMQETLSSPVMGKMEMILEDFVERTVLPLAQPKSTIFVHTHYWQNDIKSWAKDTPLCFLFNSAYNVYEFIQSFYIFFLLRQKLMRQRAPKKFSITSFMFWDLPQKVQFSWKRIPLINAKRQKSLVNVQTLMPKSSILQSIQMKVPAIDLSNWKEEISEIPKIKSQSTSLKNLIEKNIKQAKRRNRFYFFIPSSEFNQLIGSGLKLKEAEVLSKKFTTFLAREYALEKLTHDLVQVFQQHPILRKWRVSIEDLNNFATVAIAHNLLPSWRYWYALPATTYSNKNLTGLGGVYICGTDKISETRLNLVNMAVNLRYRGLTSEYFTNSQE